MSAKGNPGADIPGASTTHYSASTRDSAVDSTVTGRRAAFADVRIDLAACSFAELAYFCAGVMHGAQQQAQRDDERETSRFAALHRRAAAVVRSLAEIPERDAEADAERASRRAAWWAARREGRTAE